MRNMRELWRAHFLKVFSVIDADGSGSIDKEEYLKALGMVQQLQTMEVTTDADADSMQEKFKAMLSTIFDSKLSSTELFDRRHISRYTCLYTCVYTCLYTCVCTCHYNGYIHGSSNELLDRLDTDKSGNISWDEF